MSARLLEKVSQGARELYHVLNTPVVRESWLTGEELSFLVIRDKKLNPPYPGDRTIRKLIRELRLAGMPVLRSRKHGGYRLGGTERDIQDCLTRLENEVKSRMRTIKAIRKGAATRLSRELFEEYRDHGWPKETIKVVTL